MQDEFLAVSFSNYNKSGHKDDINSPPLPRVFLDKRIFTGGARDSAVVCVDLVTPLICGSNHMLWVLEESTSLTVL